MGDILEARILAHRRLLISLVAIMADNPRYKARIETLLDENLIPMDQEEDPGIVPGEAFAEQGRSAEEITAILRQGLARANASPTE